MSSLVIDPYVILGVLEDADEESIKKSYRTLIKRYHPDISTDPNCLEISKKINVAYNTIIALRRGDTEEGSEKVVDFSEFGLEEFLQNPGNKSKSLKFKMSDNFHFQMMLGSLHTISERLGKAYYDKRHFQELYQTVYEQKQTKRKGTKRIGTTTAQSMANEIEFAENLEFTDQWVEVVTRITLNRLAGPITVADLDPITELDLSGQETASLEDLKHFKNLKVLDLSFTELDNLGALDHIDSLEVLIMSSCNYPYNFSLINLKELYLSYCESPSLTHLDRQTSLELLDLSGNSIINLGEISRLSTLTELILYQNKIASIEEIIGLPNLKRLDISFNPIRDIKPLTQLTRLEYLNLNWTRVDDFTPLLEIPGLQFVDVSYVSDRILGNNNQVWQELEEKGVVVKRQLD